MQLCSAGQTQNQDCPTGYGTVGLPDQITNIQTGLSTSNGTMHITFLPFDSSYGAIVAYAVIITTKMNGNHPPWGILSKIYSDFKSNLTDTYVTYILVQNVTRRSVRSNELDVQVGDGSKIHSYVNGPLDPKLQYRVSIAGFTDIRYDPITDTIKEEQSLVSFTNYTGFYLLNNDNDSNNYNS
ncbi:unnamed protein product [Ranitomeya imitator]|uniref:PTPRJ transmembrane domain-containing protein n=1 Tax=Ranitomeya imitator TaxID=111125 RepID=A0ABN9ML63_9NEOB|nr:unnamed protein product [Ranitomeya imitator]